MLGSVLASVVVAGCSLAPSEPKSACAVGNGDSAAAVSLTAADCAHMQGVFAAQKAAQQATAAHAAAEAEKQQAVRKYRTAVAARIRKDEQNGYRTTSVDNFELNGPELARDRAKVSIPGVYLKTSRGEFLMSSTLATSQVDTTTTPDQGISLISKDASRAAKQSFARCQKDAVKARLGCPTTILGQATLCKRTTIFGGAEAPCIAVDDSWYVAPPS
ncbi:MAG TPA: hypothetical protein VNF99_05585 [Stellaceae bacterium]|nr:hypothetical protein [Stellaceae bacterium]